jgi:aminoglycoside phosphotransferase (APT) family kinase protein
MTLGGEVRKGEDLASEGVVTVVRGVLPGVGEIGPPVRVPKGFSSESWRVGTGAGELLVKIRRHATDAAKLRSQAEAARLARSAGVPAPEVLYAGVPKALGGRPVMILRYIPGVDAEEALPGLDGPRRTALFFDFGDAVRRLHGVGLPRFTDRIGTPEASIGDWATVVGRTAERAASRNRENGVLTAPEVAGILDRLTHAAADISEVVSPALTHRDLYLANMLVSDGRLRALIDFELAKGWDPLFDFVKLGMWVFEEWPESFEPFMTAYRRATDHMPEVEERLSVCLALENFVALWNWVDLGDERLVRDSRDRLRDWMAGANPWWVKRIGKELG